MSHFQSPSLPNGMTIDLWLGDMDDDAGFGAVDSFLSADEKARAKRFHRASDRKHFERGRGKLRQLLGSCLSVAPGKISFRYTEAGKPELAAPCGLGFSVSHSENLLLIGIGIGSFGVDVEFVKPVADLEALAALAFATGERARVGRNASSGGPEAFFRLWTAKEAVLKGLGSGWMCNPSELELRRIPGGFQACLGGEGGATWSVLSFGVVSEVAGGRAVGALAVPGLPPEAQKSRILSQERGAPPPCCRPSPDRAICG